MSNEVEQGRKIASNLAESMKSLEDANIDIKDHVVEMACKLMKDLLSYIAELEKQVNK